MSKQRNTDTEIWKDPWFRKLSPLHKTMWRYLCDNCDDSGVWKYDFDLASFQIGEAVSLDDCLEAFNIGKVRIEVIKNGYLFIHGFLEFHYGELEESCNFHKKVIRLLKNHGLEGLVNPSARYKDKDNNKDKDKEKEKEKEKGDCKGEKQKYGDDGLVMLTVAQFEKLVARLGEKRTHEYIRRLNNYIASKGKRYKSHYHTILNWLGNDGLKSGNIRGQREIDQTAAEILQELTA